MLLFANSWVQWMWLKASIFLICVFRGEEKMNISYVERLEFWDEVQLSLFPNCCCPAVSGRILCQWQLRGPWVSHLSSSLCVWLWKAGQQGFFSPPCVRLRKEADMWYMHFREIRNRLPPDNTLQVNSNFLLQLKSTGWLFNLPAYLLYKSLPCLLSKIV